MCMSHFNLVLVIIGSFPSHLRVWWDSLGMSLHVQNCMVALSVLCTLV